MIIEDVLISVSEREEIASKELIEFMNIISVSNRFRIIQLIFHNREITVTDLSILLEISQPAVSQHVKVLRLSSIVKQCRRGKKIFYSLDHHGIKNNYGDGINYLRRYFLNENN
jgi:ArsR family transcriptional regulator, lead/cadmium/zinc/bismuth-responsive transcriptional repressor